MTTLSSVIKEVGGTSGPSFVRTLGHVVVNRDRCDPQVMAQVLASQTLLFWPQDLSRAAMLFEEVKAPPLTALAAAMSNPAF